MIEFILYFFGIAICVVGLSDLYLHLISKGQFLDIMDSVLMKLKNISDKGSKWALFAFKSLGGCKVCTTQRFADLGFILLVLLFTQKWYVWLIAYCLFGGLVFWLASFKNNEVNPIVKSKTIDI